MIQTATKSPAPWWAGALSGLLAAAAGVAVGTAVAALVQGVPSPIESVGNRAIDLAPPVLKDFAVNQFGTNDKPVLIGGVVATLALLAAVAGVIGRKRPAIAIGVVAVIGLIAVAAAAVDRTSTASLLLTLVPSVLTGVVSLGSLVLLLSTLTRVRAVPTGPGTVGFVRRDFLKAAAGVTVLVMIGGVVGKVLVDTLNGDEFTVFAPVDEAFAKLDPATVKTLGTPKGADTLTSVLTYHVVPGQIAPADIDGTLKTVNGADLEVSGSGDAIKVGGDQASVICGGVKTANATVYLIDTVLMPPA